MGQDVTSACPALLQEGIGVQGQRWAVKWVKVLTVLAIGALSLAAQGQPKDILFVAASATQSEIAQINPDGTGLTLLKLSGFSPRWSPDGSKFAFLTSGESSLNIAVADADGSNVRTLNVQVDLFIGLQWSPDGRFLAFITPTYELALVSVADGTVTSLGVQVGFNTSMGFPMRLFTWTPDGTRLLFPDSSGNLTYVRISDKTVTPLRLQGIDPVFHPSGSFFVFVGAVNNAPQLFVANADGSNLRPLNLQGATPLLSPDGQFLLFTSGSGSTPQAFVQQLDNTGNPVGAPVALNLTPILEGVFASWSPDSQKIAMSVSGNRLTGQIVIINRDGTGLTRLNVSGFEPQWRPLRKFVVNIPAGLSLMGLPFVPTNPTRAGLGLASGTRIAVYDTASGNYRIDDAAEPLPIAEGRAFWVKSANPQSPQVAGTPFTFPVVVSLQQGWNALGNPLSAPLAWRFTAPSNLRIRQGRQEFTIEDAIRKGLISPFVWVWNETANRYDLVYDATILPAQSGDPFRNDIPPFRGFWLFAKTSGLQLVIDSVPRSAVLASRSAPAKGDGFALALTVRKGGQVIGEGMVAVRSNVPSRLTIAPPPPAPDRPANALSLGDGNVVDVRPLGQSRYLWTVQVQDGDELIWHGTMPRGWQGILVDKATGAQVSLRQRSRYPLNGRSTLLLVLQRDTDQPLRVVNLQAQRMRGRGVRISFGLTAPAQVKAVIMTLTGRIVRVLDGGSRMAGTHQLFWQGDTEGGNPAPVGVYLLRLQATDEQGRQVQAARTVMWR